MATATALRRPLVVIAASIICLGSSEPDWSLLEIEVDSSGGWLGERAVKRIEVTDDGARVTRREGDSDGIAISGTGILSSGRLRRLERALAAIDVRAIADADRQVNDAVVSTVTVTTDRWRHRYTTNWPTPVQARVFELVNDEVLRAIHGPRLSAVIQDRDLERWEQLTEELGPDPLEPTWFGTVPADAALAFARHLGEESYSDRYFTPLANELATIGDLDWVVACLADGIDQANRIELDMLARIARLGSEGDHEPIAHPADARRLVAARDRILAALRQPDAADTLYRRSQTAFGQLDGHLQLAPIFSLLLAANHDRALDLLRDAAEPGDRTDNQVELLIELAGQVPNRWLVDRLLDALERDGAHVTDRIAVEILDRAAETLSYPPYMLAYPDFLPMPQGMRARLRAALLAAATHPDDLTCWKALVALEHLPVFRLGEDHDRRCVRLSLAESQRLLDENGARDHQIVRHTIDVIGRRCPRPRVALAPLLQDPEHRDHAFLWTVDPDDELELRRLCRLLREPGDLDPDDLLAASRRCASEHTIAALVDCFADRRYRYDSNVSRTLKAVIPAGLEPPAYELAETIPERWRLWFTAIGNVCRSSIDIGSGY